MHPTLLLKLFDCGPAMHCRASHFPLHHDSNPHIKPMFSAYSSQRLRLSAVLLVLALGWVAVTALGPVQGPLASGMVGRALASLAAPVLAFFSALMFIMGFMGDFPQQRAMQQVLAAMGMVQAGVQAAVDGS